jgi:hypothetical protein
MGKNSLIKSTTKKKSTAKKSAEEKKTRTSKKKAAAGKPSASSQKKTIAPQKAKGRAKKSTSRKSPEGKASTRSAPAARKPAKKSPRELLFQKFDWPQPPPRIPSPEAEAPTPDAPPYFAATDEKELQRLRTVQFRSFSMEELKTAAEKAEAEKAAAEKAEAEKAAAEKAEAEKAAREKEAPEAVKVSYEDTGGDGSGGRKLPYGWIGAAGFVAFLFLVLIVASNANHSRFYLKSSEGGLVIRRGAFAPMGDRPFMVLPGVQAPETRQEVYGKSEVFPIIFRHQIDRADALLGTDDVPDFSAVQSLVEAAVPYAVTDEMREAAYARLDGIHFHLLLYKADVAARRGSPEDLERALALLEEAGRFNWGDERDDLVKARMESVQQQMSAMEAAEQKPAASAG